MKMKQVPLARPRLWLAMRELKVFDRQSLLNSANKSFAELGEIQSTTLHGFLCLLMNEGYVEIVERGRHNILTYELVKDTGVEAPVFASNKKLLCDPNLSGVDGISRIWRVLRVAQLVSQPDLESFAGIEYTSSFGQYLQSLRQAEYIQTQNWRGRSMPPSHRLIRNTGPLAPRIVTYESRAKQAIADLNTKTLYPLPERCTQTAALRT